MALPSALRKAEEEANALIQSGNQPPTAANDDNTGDPTQTLTPEPLKQQGTPAPADSDDWKAKYQVLQGKYNAEVPRMKDELDALRQKVEAGAKPDPETTRMLMDLKAANDELKNQLAEAQKQPAQLNQYLTDEYGEEFAQAVAEQAEQLAEQKTSALRKELDAIRNEIGSVQKTNKEASSNMLLTTIATKLKAHNIDFDQVDRDPMFREWLGEPDPFSGMPRGSLLHQAFNQGDVDRTVGFYTAYKAHERSRLGKPNSPFEQHVDPVGRNNPPDMGTDGDFWSTAQIDALYNAYSKGQISEAEFAKQEQSLFRALNAGNVQ
ncbi:hypothetical protein [Bowmanella sp. JS7-9]|uniref:Uncharacterized protein n=1 Tax=Pseudobowmanella zhangzhouensis TaxID=1537679 RepID=A0ABW1XQM6_9ALTE|nr:hypothetical protein [Bowmanella sp. JS7-9]TBX21919.1 hypothetical protein TK45_10550 [Bowmanella sp. JS7-9]